jgi:serine/threonine protein kinase
MGRPGCWGPCKADGQGTKAPVAGDCCEQGPSIPASPHPTPRTPRTRRPTSSTREPTCLTRRSARPPSWVGGGAGAPCAEQRRPPMLRPPAPPATLPGACLPCPLPAAPEVRSGGAYRGKPADMWALGVTLYCFLFADLPFKASSPHACCLAGWVCSALLQPECLPLPCVLDISLSLCAALAAHQGATLDELYEAVQTQEVRYPEHISVRCASSGPTSSASPCSKANPALAALRLPSPSPGVGWSPRAPACMMCGTLPSTSLTHPPAVTAPPNCAVPPCAQCWTACFLRTPPSDRPQSR